MKYRQKINGQWSNWINFNIKALDGMPIGSIIMFAGETIPTGWLICNGDTLNEEEYPELYDIIGHTYGGSGLDFNLPDFRGRAGFGYDDMTTGFYPMGNTGGEKAHTLTVNEMPSHNHNFIDNNSNITNVIATFVSGGSWDAAQNSGYRKYESEYIAYTGGGQPHNNMPPYIVVNYIIKATNTTPTMASVVNATNNSTEDTYSCNYSNEHYGGVVLYNDATGANGNITLSDNINNYRYIEIYASWATEYCIPAVKLSTEDLTNNKFYISWNDVGNDKTIFNKQYTISGTSITKVSMNYYIINKSETSTWDECRIHRVVGYK